MKIIENIARWICKKLTKEQVVLMVEYLQSLLESKETEFKKPDPVYPNYRKFEVDPEPPLKKDTQKKAKKKNYKQILKKKDVKPIQYRSDNIPPTHIRCPHCNAPSKYIWINNGHRKNVQYKCAVCKRTFCRTPKISTAKYFCPICGKPLFRWKVRLLVTLYKCGNDKCPRYLVNLKKLSPEEKEMRKEKSSQFKVRYIYREYKINLKSIINKEVELPAQKLSFSRYSLSTVGLILTFFNTLGLSTRQTAFALKRIFGIPISHTTVSRIARIASFICHNFNIKKIPKVPGAQAADETYIKIKGTFHYVWLAISKFRSIITTYKVADNRGEIPAVETVYNASIKHQPDNNSKEPFTFVTDGNPSYQAAITFLKTEGLEIDHKKVIGLENNDEESALYRYLKNIIERVNRTYKHYATNCFQNIKGASAHLSLSVTNYNFIRPHSSLDYEPPVVLDELKNIRFVQDVWAKIITCGVT